MQIGIVTNRSKLSAYVAEILKTWGLPLYAPVSSDMVPDLDPTDFPVLVCPAYHDEATLPDYARRGGTVLCFLPGRALARAAGLKVRGTKEPPLRLRNVAYPTGGLAGEFVPVVGSVHTWELSEAAKPLAYLSHPGRYGGETAGIAETRVGGGRIVSFAFDLPRCVLLLRQGDPDLAESIPDGDGCARPTHMAARVGPYDAGWIPHADLLSRLFTDLARRYLPAPVPVLSHLPRTAPGILLYSGDEDYADVASNEDEFDGVADAGGRMSLYIIPNHTKSTPDDVARYARRHDVGPHPNLRPLDGRPVPERVAEFERQVRLFEERFRIPARTLRNHCTAWAGYLDLVDVMEKLGVQMDGNYFSGTYMRDRENAPYASFGAALPMRFCHPDGRLVNVYQQHTHLIDDGMFGPQDYSFKLSPAVFSVMLERIFTDITTRFHTPYGVCIHPGNWVRFSEEQGRELLRLANEKGLPIWSFDQWAAFWSARDTWRLADLQWNGSRLGFSLQRGSPHPDLRIQIPLQFAGASVGEIRVDGNVARPDPNVRYREHVGFVSIPEGRSNVSIEAVYHPNPH
ncbi:MAG: hypothetical protein OXR72_20425 [Gemmatimonadota bacterium]|nr:hypothetical protein [Gemmatimonadota bacterium]